MNFKLSCLYGCGFVAEGEDRSEVGLVTKDHLETEHQIPADPGELAECAIRL